MSEVVFSEGAVTLFVETTRDGGGARVRFTLDVPGDEGDVWLHWGVGAGGGRWRAPPDDLWPRGSRAFDDHAVQSRFTPYDDARHVELSVPRDWIGRELRFVVLLEQSGRWINNGGGDFALALEDAPRRSPTEVFGDEEVTLEELPGERAVAWRVASDEERARVRIVTNLAPPVVLHWGLLERGRRWRPPPEDARPAGSRQVDERAVQSPFVALEDLSELVLELDPGSCGGVGFVLKQGERWIKRASGGDFVVALSGGDEVELGQPGGAVEEMYEAIVGAETGRGSWTLMHRYDLCHELLSRLPDDAPARQRALAMITSWLRFSALRQLDWQRNYNTKPRELAHAQERLTCLLASLYARERASRLYVRLMLASLGHGADGQRVRDEILEIMHRHRVKEVTGHFMEEWHQKLHNNTTYDDVVICEGYLAFLRADGDAEVFYDHLAARGITRERLASYERPIVTPPDLRPELKEGLLHDFSRYLVTLKRVHEGTDLGVAFERASAQLPTELRRKIEPLQRADAMDPASLCRRLVGARRALEPLLARGEGARDALFLDLALDERLRVVVEAAREEIASLHGWVQLGWTAAENVARSFDDDELMLVAGHLRDLAEKGRVDRLRAREIYALSERAARVLAELADGVGAALQPWAERLGHAFGAEPFTIELFSEEVIRGRAPFALSAALRGLARPLRHATGLGAWEVVSPATVVGTLREVGALRELMSRPPSEPTLALCERVDGDEEIPPTVVGVIARASVDLVSHLAVRARNAGVLLVTAHEREAIDELAARRGERLHLELLGGALRWRSATDDEDDVARERPPLTEGSRRVTPASPSLPWALDEGDFDDEKVGAKSRTLAAVRSALEASDVLVPRAFALPFGRCERALGACPELQREHDALIASLEGAPRQAQLRAFAALRRLVLAIEPPEGVAEALEAAAARAHLPWPAERWPTIWERVKQVWASKWTDRAALARRARGMPDEALSMGVLVQEIVPAELAFVLHSVDPRDGDHERLFGEVVVGLGETLVGNHPGRALSFCGHKTRGELEIVSFPSKSRALRGRGLIFRSDSSGEDLEGYAGAGLYESVLLDPMESELVDYRAIPRLTNAEARDELLRDLLRLGVDLEARLGCPQDVEGVVSKKGYHVVQTRPQVGLDDRA